MTEALLTKPSGSFWTENIPADWTEPNLRYVASIRNGSDYKEFQVEDGGYPVIGSGGVFARTSKYLHDGESVLLGRKGTVDKPLYVDGRFWTVDTMFYTNIGQRVLAKFLHYFATTIPFDYFQTSTAVPSMTQGDLGSIKVPLPALERQRQIVDFLDRETGQIDALIGKQGRLIELLTEKRQAIITHAVTKGLDPTAPTKSSGIPWLGDLPGHWTTSRLKWTRPTQESGTSVNGMDVPAGSDEFRVLKTGAVSKGYFVPEANKTVVPEDVDRVTCPVRGGTLIVNRANTPDLVGSTGRTFRDAPSLFLSDKLWQIDFERADTNFIYWWSKTDVYRSQIQFRRVGASSSMQNLSYPDFLTVDIALPALEEQQTIAKYIDGRTAAIDVLKNKAQKAIALLRERRSALISAAVIGRIDVREGASKP